jgi:class 3 adenylate cyclase/predicted ATPase
MAENMRCAKCGSDNRDGRKFCGDCGASLSARCASCGAENEPTEKFCGGCGVALAAKVQAGSVKAPAIQPPFPEIRVWPEQPDAAAVIDGERKTVTALFADIKGSTELMEDLDPEEARAIIDPALKLMIDAVHRYDGYVVQSTGDGIFALFGAPVAHEDHPQRALHAALATRDELRRRDEGLRMRGRSGVEARIGINTGEVVMRTVQTGGHTEYSPVGHVINLAARMQSAAPPNGIVITEETRRLVEGYFALRGLAPTEIRGVSGLVNVYEVVDIGVLRGHFELAALRGLTRFVGRERELGEMRRALELTVGGRGQIVAVVADAGTGKSRLFHEFKATLPAECKVLEAYSVSHGKASAWLPVLELLRGYFGIQDADDAAVRREKVRAAIGALDPTLGDAAPYLWNLLAIQQDPDPLAQMDAQVKHRRSLEAIKRIILRESLNQPLVVIFEDLHWIDSETQALLDLLADSIGSACLLLLVNYRPEYRHEWSGRGHYLQLRLDPLGAENATEMLRALLGEGTELDPVKRLIAERTGGNPFFIEEVVQALFEQGILARNGVVKLVRQLAHAHLPVTVQGMLTARIDRLPARDKELLQTLTVIGTEFPFTLARQVTKLPHEELERGLANLRFGEFIYEQPALSDVEYAFKHALTHEVAYNSLLVERRKLLHERAGQALESMFAGQLDDHLSELARQYSRSDNIIKAVKYLERAGHQSLQRSALADAISSFTRATGLLQKLPDGTERIRREVRMQLALGNAFWALRGYSAPEAEQAFTRARELCEQLGDPPELSLALFGLWGVYYLRGKLRPAYELAERLLRRAQTAQDSTALMLAHQALGDVSYSMGEFLRARDHLEMELSLHNPEVQMRFSVEDIRVNPLCYLGWTLWHLGYPDQALKCCSEALALARARPYPHSVAFAESFAGFLFQYRREPHAAQETAERLITLCSQHGLSLWLAIATTKRGFAISQQGSNEEGIAQIQEGIAATRAAGTELRQPTDLSMLAEACLGAGRLNEGLAALTDALTAVDENDNRSWEAETHRLKGELLLRQDSSKHAEARGCFERAIEIARQQSSRSLELRATVSLARLLAQQDRRDEARTMLADIYGWFTEGFDTVDLKEAKALLDELNS